MSESDNNIDETQTPLESPHSTKPKAKNAGKIAKKILANTYFFWLISDSLNIETALDDFEVSDDKVHSESTARGYEKNDQSVLNFKTDENEIDNKEIEYQTSRLDPYLDSSNNDSTEKQITYDDKEYLEKENSSGKK